MGNRDKGRFAVYAMGGVYLIYLAYHMLKTQVKGGTEAALMIIFAVLFLIIGVGILGFSFYMFYTFGKKRSQNEGRDKENILQENDNAMGDLTDPQESSVKGKEDAVEIPDDHRDGQKL